MAQHNADALYRQVVVGTDGSTTATRAVARAIAIAGLTGASVHVVTATRPIEIHVSAARQFASHRGEAPPAAVVARDLDPQEALVQAKTLAEAAGVAAQSHVVEGEPVSAILSVADSVKADLVIVGSVGVDRRVLGSVPRAVSQRASCDVLIVHTT